jgi:hypothetical protein
MLIANAMVVVDAYLDLAGRQLDGVGTTRIIHSAVGEEALDRFSASPQVRRASVGLVRARTYVRAARQTIGDIADEVARGADSRGGGPAIAGAAVRDGGRVERARRANPGRDIPRPCRAGRAAPHLVGGPELHRARANQHAGRGPVGCQAAAKQPRGTVLKGHGLGANLVRVESQPRVASGDRLARHWSARIAASWCAMTSSVCIRTEEVSGFPPAVGLAGCDLGERSCRAHRAGPTGLVRLCPPTSGLLHPLLHGVE